MRVAIEAILEQQNKTLYWLAQQTDCHYYSLKKLCKNETSSISFEILEKVCNVLNCAPNDILILNEYINKIEE